jgi:HAE1 family hydrophobic/amphiphilic exporter-1
MDHRPASLAFSLAILLGTYGLYKLVPKGFIPTEDTGTIQGSTETLEGSSYDAMVQHQLAVAEVIGRNPYVDHYMSRVGQGTTNQGQLTLRLKPRSQRPSADAIVRQLQPQLAAIPGVRSYLSVPPVIRIGGRNAKAPYQFTMQGADIEALYDNAAKLEARLRTVPILQDVSTDLQIKNPQAQVQIDRDRASRLGVTVQQIEEALYDAYGSRQVSTIYTDNNQYWVIQELLPEYQLDLSSLRLLYIRSQQRTLVPLTSVATVTPGLGPLTVNHSGQLPSVTLSFNLAPNVALGAGVSAVQRAAGEILPSTISTGFSGTAQAFQDSLQGMLFLLILAVAVIYIVLGILYESFIHPLTILSGLPFAGFGALLTLLVFGTELSIYAFVGIIMLVGLVKKNAIMMIDFALEAERREGKSPREAILEACSVRFRPIMMTTMAALMGTLPIAIGWGAGGESRQPLGLAVVGGLAFSQLITLYVTPVFYTYLDTLQQWLGRRVAAAPVPEPVSAD